MDRPDRRMDSRTGDLPILGRVFEVQAGELEISRDEYVTPLETDSDDHAESTGGADSARAMVLPFLGPVWEYAPGTAITIERRLSLEEDLHLADHAFIYAPGIKPLSACLPVLPMTMSLEAMAEVAACLAPGFGLLGFEAVKAVRWIELADTDAVVLHLTARLERYDADCNVYYIGTAIYLAGQNSPAITGVVILGDRYRVGPPPARGAPSNSHSVTAAQIYAERHMFHGPSFQCMVGEIAVGREGVTGEFQVRSPETLFRSTRSPQLLAAPALLDAVGQIIGVWALEQDRYAFPIGFAKLEIYRPTPPIGTSVPVRVDIVKAEGKTICANVEIEDGSGDVWMRIADWRSWKFRWERRLVDFRRLPHRYLLAQDAPLTSLHESAVCLMLDTTQLAGFDAATMARYCLSMEEMAIFAGHERVPRRQQQWLLGRIVAKDAVRRWLAQREGTPIMLHPAAFTIDSDDLGRPFVASLPDGGAPPLVSIAHCETRAIAVAHGGAAGVDIERIASRDAMFTATFTTAQERSLLERFSEAERDERITQLWCAKEAVGKLLGTGIGGKLKGLEAFQIKENGVIGVRRRGSDRSFKVVTITDGEFIIALAH